MITGELVLAGMLVFGQQTDETGNPQYSDALKTVAQGSMIKYGYDRHLKALGKRYENKAKQILPEELHLPIAWTAFLVKTIESKKITITFSF